jgi:proteic killer suppression protein
MEVDYKDKKLALLETDQAHQTKLPVSVINSYRRKVIQLMAAHDERDLRNLKGLNYEKLKGNREGQRSIRLNDAWRAVFTLDESVKPPRIEMLEITNHYK